MNGFELISKLVESLVWPVVVVFLVYSLRDHLSKIVDRLRMLKASKEGFELSMGEISKEVIGKELPPEIEKKIEDQQILVDEGNANGSYRLYSNGVLVTRRKVTLYPGHTSHRLIHPIAMINEATSVQFIGDIQAKVLSLDKQSIEFSFDLQHSERVVEIVVTGL